MADRPRITLPGHVATLYLFCEVKRAYLNGNDLIPQNGIAAKEKTSAEERT